MIVLLTLASTIIYYIERQTQPEAFSSIPKAMWWGMATLTTVGYGDVVPHSATGRVFGIVVMFIGIGMFAVPTGIIVSGFSQEIKRKDFIVTWNLVAHVPSFSQLDAVQIAHICELLRVRTAMLDEVIFREGDEADSMYFIVSGKVEIESKPQSVHLAAGEFFGEFSLIYKRRRTATVIARSFAELLRLDARDFEALLETNQELRERIRAQAEAVRAKVQEPAHQAQENL
jgi:voltage-gated potassium channel